MKVCVGGTFNIFHKGHKKLLDKALEIAGKNGTVYIGITHGNIVKHKKFLKPYHQRKRAIQQYLTSKGYEKKAIILPIDHKYGLTPDGDFDAIVISPETLENAKEINKERKKRGKKLLRIIKIPYVLAQDKKPISSTRIHQKEIDEEGNLITES